MLINNAGIQPPDSCVPLHTLEDHYWHSIMNINLNATFYLSKLVLPVMIAQHEEHGFSAPGVIINMASVQGVQSQKGVPAYAAAKGRGAM